MNVHDLILDRGLIGALKYADEVEKTNHKLASEIDLAVKTLYSQINGDSFIKTAQFQPLTPYRPQTSPAALSNSPVQSNTPIQTIQPKNIGVAKKPQSPWLDNTGVVPSAINGAYRYKVLQDSLGQFYKLRLKEFQDALRDVVANRSDDVAMNKAAEILSKSPHSYSQGNMFNGKTVRQLFNEEAQRILKSEPQLLSNLHDRTAFLLAKPAPSFLDKAKGRLGLGTAENFLHPSVKNFTPFGLSPDDTELLKKKLVGKGPAEIRDIMINAGLEDAFEAHMSPGGKGYKAVQQAVSKGVGASEGMLAKALEALSAKFPALAEFMPKIFKFLGPLAVILEAKGFFDDLQKYGMDGKTTCNLISLLLGAASLIPPIAAVAGPLWMIASVGCMFVQHDQSKTPDAAITQAMVEQRAASITFDQLTAKDKASAEKLFIANQDNETNLQSAFNDARRNKVFEKPLDVMAAIYKQMNTGNVFPTYVKKSYNHLRLSR